MNYNENLRKITSILDSQTKQINNLNTNLKELVLNQNKILEKLYQKERRIYLLKTRKRLRNIIYLFILIFIFYYFSIFEFMINCYNYYYYYLDLFGKISDIAQNTETIQNNVDQILQKQKQILNLTYKDISKTGTTVPFSTPKVLKTFWLY